MNKFLKKVFLLLVMVIQINLINGQSIYLKSTGAFGIPVSKQTIPEYFTFRVFLPGTSGLSFGVMRQGDAKFSIAEGIRFDEAIGYNLNKLISFELGISYYTNTKREFVTFPSNGLTNWHFKNVSLMPKIIIGKSINDNSRVNFMLSSGVGVSNVNVTASIPDYFSKYSFNNTICYSYGYGVEYLHNLSQKIQLTVNAGLNHLFYTPKHAELVSSTVNLQYLAIIYKQIDYLDKIDTYNNNAEQPETRPQETLKANNLYLGVGVKYTFFNKEKK
jgi:hypothetical protein